MKTIEELAEDHADFLAEWTRVVAKQCFIHGAKHMEEMKDDKI